MDKRRQLEMLHTMAGAVHVLWRTHAAVVQQAEGMIVGSGDKIQIIQAFDVELHNIRHELGEEIANATKKEGKDEGEEDSGSAGDGNTVGLRGDD